MIFRPFPRLPPSICAAARHYRVAGLRDKSSRPTAPESPPRQHRGHRQNQPHEPLLCPGKGGPSPAGDLFSNDSPPNGTCFA